MNKNPKIIQNPDGSFTYFHDKEFVFDSGEVIDELFLTFETHGNIDLPAVVINHALSSNFHIKSSKKNPNPGWWEKNIGPNNHIDTNKYFVICIGNLGSYLNCSNPSSINKKTNLKYHSNFPEVSVNDIARAQLIVLKAMNIAKIHALIGNSMGGYIALTLAMHLEHKLTKLISISSAYKSYPTNNAIHSIQRGMIINDPNWNNGNYSEKNFNGFINARKLGLISYFNPDYLNNRWDDPADLESYLDYNAKKFCDSFAPHTYLSCLDTMDAFDINKYTNSGQSPFEKIYALTTIIAVDSDHLCSHQQQQELLKKLQQHKVEANLTTVKSTKGHDAFYTDVNIAKEIAAALR